MGVPTMKQIVAEIEEATIKILTQKVNDMCVGDCLVHPKTKKTIHRLVHGWWKVEWLRYDDKDRAFHDWRTK